jgi:hypothetical protein
MTLVEGGLAYSAKALHQLIARRTTGLKLGTKILFFELRTNSSMQMAADREFRVTPLGTW